MPKMLANMARQKNWRILQTGFQDVPGVSQSEKTCPLQARQNFIAPFTSTGQTSISLLPSGGGEMLSSKKHTGKSRPQYQ